MSSSSNLSANLQQGMGGCVTIRTADPITYSFDWEWHGAVDQVALGVSENAICGDLWIDSIRTEMGPAGLVPLRPDVASRALSPRSQYRVCRLKASALGLWGVAALGAVMM